MLQNYLLFYGHDIFRSLVGCSWELAADKFMSELSVKVESRTILGTLFCSALICWNQLRLVVSGRLMGQLQSPTYKGPIQLFSGEMHHHRFVNLFTLFCLAILRSIILYTNGNGTVTVVIATGCRDYRIFALFLFALDEQDTNRNGG